MVFAMCYVWDTRVDHMVSMWGTYMVHMVSMWSTYISHYLTQTQRHMTLTTALGMLRCGNNGEEILQILDVIQQDTDTTVNVVENDTSITLEF